MAEFHDRSESIRKAGKTGNSSLFGTRRVPKRELLPVEKLDGPETGKVICIIFESILTRTEKVPP
jgi:hypothetical protein